MSQAITAQTSHAEWMRFVGQSHCRVCDAANDRSSPCCHACGSENEDWNGDEED